MADVLNGGYPALACIDGNDYIIDWPLWGLAFDQHTAPTQPSPVSGVD
jgi:hypothetical protein